MPILKIALDDHTYQQLAQDACTEERSIPGQASVLIRRALGLSAPTPEVVDPQCRPSVLRDATRDSSELC